MGRKYPIGSEIIRNEGVHFRVWAPDHDTVFLVIESQKKTIAEMKKEKEGYFSLMMPTCNAGDLYKYRLGKSENSYPDPASRYQPIGPEGPSMVVETAYPWEDDEWKGVSIEGQVIYEMHVGTFTKEGDFKSARQKLPYLSELGITIIEMMPLNEFPGRFGWGYDGVNFFAPCHLYGKPHELKEFVDAAHKLGIGVILDVVYNHIGPEYNYYPNYSRNYLKTSSTDWGPAINFDNKEVKDFFLTNLRYWIEEFHFDGFRFDAVWTISCSDKNCFSDMANAARKAAGQKQIIVIGECEPQDATFLRSQKEGGYGFDALWNEDFHHTAKVRLTGMRDAYFSDYLGSPQEFISCFKYGFLYQGQYYEWQKQGRGTPSKDIAPSQMIIYLENHDQIGNTMKGEHLSAYVDKGNLKALTALLLLSPNTPMLFQGQEIGTETPFLYFADHSPEVSKLVLKGRRKFLSQFFRCSTPKAQSVVPDPSNIKTFMSCKLDNIEHTKQHSLFNFHRNLIALRKQDPVFQTMQTNSIDGAVLSPDVFLIRYFNVQDGDRLLIVNLGANYYFSPMPEPLIAPSLGTKWEVIFSTEEHFTEKEEFFVERENRMILGHSALVLKEKY